MKIAIVKLSSLGDILHAMIVLQLIKQHNQTIEIDWIVDEIFVGLLKDQPDINNIHSVKLKEAKERKSFFSFVRELTKLRKLYKYDIVIDMQGLVKSSIVAKLIPSVLTIGFEKSSSRESLSALLYNRTFKIDYSENVIFRNIGLVEYALEFSVPKKNIYTKTPFLYSNKKYNLNSVSKIKKNILLIPGSSIPAKSYPSNKLAKLTNLVDENFIITWGNFDEKEIAERIKKLSINSNVSVCDKLSIENLKSIVSQMDLVIGPDSGPTHMAWALNVPSITLFGATPGYRNSLSTKINKTIESESRVNPYKINRSDYSIGDIKVKEIIELVDCLLKDA